MKFQNMLMGLLWMLLGVQGLAQAQETKDVTLDNGMKIIVREDSRSPVVVHMIWYRAGSMDETSGTTGVAHVLEHMMFKGTKKYGQGEFSRIVASLGGRDNAFTSRDYTAYFQQIGNGRLARMMELEADRMRHLRLTPDAFDKEIQVIMEERRWRTEDQPASLLSEGVCATAFMEHPYHWPVIGWMNDLENMKAADAQDWYGRWYVPGNAVMVVVGDVKAPAVFAMAKKYFGKIPSRKMAERRPRVEPPQRGIRRVTVKAPAENPVVALAFRVPALRSVENDKDVYALDVLSAILDGYDNARLPAKLVRADRVASSVSVEYDALSRGPSLFVMTAVPLGRTGTDELEKRLRAEIARIAQEGVSPEELERVKMQIVSSQIYKRDSLFGQAMEIGVLEMTGIGYRQMDKVIEKLKAVTADDVKAVAARYFGDDALTVGTLSPLPLSQARKLPQTPLRH
ncbi:MAG: insulinase family protein [Burkholderiaceae bacterium]|jgi:zinc protease|nr:insulinase family protein [Burkholderiaceae bacterium]